MMDRGVHTSGVRKRTIQPPSAGRERELLRGRGRRSDRRLTGVDGMPVDEPLHPVARTIRDLSARHAAQCGVGAGSDDTNRLAYVRDHLDVENGGFLERPNHGVGDESRSSHLDVEVLDKGVLGAHVDVVSGDVPSVRLELHYEPMDGAVPIDLRRAVGHGVAHAAGGLVENSTEQRRQGDRRRDPGKFACRVEAELLDGRGQNALERSDATGVRHAEEFLLGERGQTTRCRAGRREEISDSGVGDLLGAERAESEEQGNNQRCDSHGTSFPGQFPSF